MNMAPSAYSRWISKNIPFGVESKDYFLEKISHNGSHQEYLFTLEFARALCLVAKTSAAKKLRVFLFTL
jgi:phage anti-repressor protein